MTIYTRGIFDWTESGPTRGRPKVVRRALHGPGRGLELLDVDTGSTAAWVLTDRGAGIHKATLNGVQLGWNSGLGGPVNAAGADPAANGGLGWLNYFSDWLVRCGLQNAGAPFVEDGRQFPLHGRIALAPAVKCSYEVKDNGTVVFQATYHDFTPVTGTWLELESTTTFSPVGEIAVHDVVTNKGPWPTPSQMLYHINFGGILAGSGSSIHVPHRAMAPRDGMAQSDPQWQRYDPTLDVVESVFYFDPVAGPDGWTRAMLQRPDGNQAVTVMWDTRQMPCLTVWKLAKQGGSCVFEDSGVVGLEPGHAFPNPRPFEMAQGRVGLLDPGTSLTMDLKVVAHPNVDSVAAAREAINALQRWVEPTQRATPNPDWSPS